MHGPNPIPKTHSACRFRAKHRFRRSACLAVLSSVIAIAGCTTESTFNAHGPAARSIGQLSLLMTILFSVTTIVMWVLLGYAFYRRRGSLSDCDRRYRHSADCPHCAFYSGTGAASCLSDSRNAQPCATPADGQQHEA